jgi:hypothetical protein
MAYLSAIDDVPPWAVAEAIRRWHRGEGGGKDANYRFAPAPAELRYAAMQAPAAGQADIRAPRGGAERADDRASGRPGADRSRAVAADAAGNTMKKFERKIPDTMAERRAQILAEYRFYEIDPIRIAGEPISIELAVQLGLLIDKAAMEAAE